MRVTSIHVVHQQRPKCHWHAVARGKQAWIGWHQARHDVARRNPPREQNKEKCNDSQVNTLKCSSKASVVPIAGKSKATLERKNQKKKISKPWNSWKYLCAHVSDNFLVARSCDLNRTRGYSVKLSPMTSVSTLWKFRMDKSILCPM